MNSNTYNPQNGSVIKSIGGSRIIKFEDPASVLNLSDKKWNEIVQKGARDYIEENKNKQLQKLEANRKIMDEQKKQIEAKNATKGVRRELDKEFFHKVGAQSSDVYYINEDKKNDFKNQLKGNAGKMSEILRQKHHEQKKDKLIQRKQKEEARKEAQAKFEEEEKQLRDV